MCVTLVVLLMEPSGPSKATKSGRALTGTQSPSTVGERRARRSQRRRVRARPQPPATPAAPAEARLPAAGATVALGFGSPDSGVPAMRFTHDSSVIDCLAARSSSTVFTVVVSAHCPVQDGSDTRVIAPCAKDGKHHAPNVALIGKAHPFRAGYRNGTLAARHTRAPAVRHPRVRIQ